MQNHKLELRMLGEITSDMQVIPLSCKKWRETEEPLDEGKRRQWKSWLKLNIQKLRSWHLPHLFRANRRGEMEAVTDFLSLGSRITTDDDCSHKIKRRFLLRRKAITNLGSIEKIRDIALLTKVHRVKAALYSNHVWMWELDHKEGWVPKNWCFWIVVLGSHLESPLDYKEIKPVNPKGNQPWRFIGRIDAEAPILWPPDAKNWLIGKDPDAGKGLRQKEKEVAEGEMVR